MLQNTLEHNSSTLKKIFQVKLWTESGQTGAIGASVIVVTKTLTIIEQGQEHAPILPRVVLESKCVALVILFDL